MPFVTIKGSFHLCGQSANGNPTGFQPDGDSMQFKPDDASLLDRLEKTADAYRLTSIGSTQLRFEGIDALELHFEGHHQPRPLADDSRDYLTGLLGLNPVPYSPPKNVTVKPPVAHDGTRGYILSRALEAHGRPVAFAFAGDPASNNGDSVTLRAPLLRKSLNYKSLAAGNAYPLYYDTLFASLRATFTANDASALASEQLSDRQAEAPVRARHERRFPRKRHRTTAQSRKQPTRVGDRSPPSSASTIQHRSEAKNPSTTMPRAPSGGVLWSGRRLSGRLEMAEPGQRA
jgi:hypothetical protein